MLYFKSAQSKISNRKEVNNPESQHNQSKNFMSRREAVVTEKKGVQKWSKSLANSVKNLQKTRSHVVYLFRVVIQIPTAFYRI
jgi:hypothetical protein